MNRKRDLRDIGKTYEEVLAKKIDNLWILFLKYNYSGKGHHTPLYKLLPVNNMPPKWVNIFKELKPEKQSGHDRHIKTFEGKLSPTQTMRYAHISDLRTLKELMREAFAGDVKEDSDFSDNLKPKAKEVFGDIMDNL